MNPVIGIISYLPDDSEVREVRCSRCINLIEQASRLFNLPIILIAQNWSIDDVKKIKCSTTVTINTYSKLGITRAREVLRMHFLKTEYDYLITMDDDLEFIEKKKVIKKYLKNLDGFHFVEVQNWRMNMLALPRDICEKEKFDLANDPERGQGYEDWIYVMNLLDKYGERYVNFDEQITKTDRHTMTLDPFSTWKNKEAKDQTDISRTKIAINKIKHVEENPLSKCIGIISWLPDDPVLRQERKRRCLKLFETINDHFKLPILLVAQNWKEEDYSDLDKFKNQTITIEKMGKLGITGARIELRRMYLEDTDYEYIILLDDDSDLLIGDGGVLIYMYEIDTHPNMFGVWRRGFPRLMAISRSSYSKLSFDFIKGLEAERGEVWEDDAYHKVFCALYPNEVYQFSKYNMQEVSKFSEFDDSSTWGPTKEKQAITCRNTNNIVVKWVDYEKRRLNEN